MTMTSVILAAGQGTRMKSDLPKVLHRIAGKPMILYSLDAARKLASKESIVVVGHGGEQVIKVVQEYSQAAAWDNVSFVEQREQRGTGHAVLQVQSRLEGAADTILVTCGDMPLLRAETLEQLAHLHASSGATVTMLTVVSDESMGFGRILRDGSGRVLGIVEEGDATPEQRKIRELNCGVYCFRAQWLWPHLRQLTPQGNKHELYLTDLVAMAVHEGRAVEASLIEDPAEAIGINTRVHLANAERVMRGRINERLMESGVTLIDPATTYIEDGVYIGCDTIIEPNTHIAGWSHIGENCRIGPDSMLEEVEIGDGCEVIASVVRQSKLEKYVHVGPFADVRPGCHLEESVYVGNHAEIKHSHLGREVHVGHFSYVGDSEIGARTNIGAGTITCNFDGKAKHRTIVGEDAFIGSDTLLRAPVRIGDRATTGAGSVVTRDVPADSTAVGAPARVIKKPQ